MNVIASERAEGTRRVKRGDLINNKILIDKEIPLVATLLGTTLSGRIAAA